MNAVISEYRQEMIKQAAITGVVPGTSQTTRSATFTRPMARADFVVLRSVSLQILP
jgi:hypothetical protein